jgi:hypothetical protein
LRSSSAFPLTRSGGTGVLQNSGGLSISLLYFFIGHFVAGFVDGTVDLSGERIHLGFKVNTLGFFLITGRGAAHTGHARAFLWWK